VCTEWLDYLDGVEPSYPEDIALFPYIDEEPDDERTRLKMLKARFRWLKDFRHSMSRKVLFAEWQNRDILIDTRTAQRHVDLHDFYNREESLGLHLLRSEVDNLSYYKQLRDALKLRIRRDMPVLIFGPTAGAEVEAITDAGCSPKIVVYDPKAPWVNQLHERMFHDSQEYEVYTYDEFARSQPESRFVVLSNFIPDIPTALRLASAHVGSHGFVLFSSANRAFIRGAKTLGLIRVDGNREDLAVNFKHRAFTEQE
jgi:hypothetical protein